MERNTEMINNTVQLEKEVYELIGNSSLGNSLISINALEAASLILDNKFGIDFHKKNPKLTVRFAETILKNIRMNNLKDAIQNGMGDYLDAIKSAIQHKDSKAKEPILDDYLNSFRF